MLRLAAPALAEALEGIAEPGGVAVFLAGPEPLEDRPDPMAGEFLSYLARQAGVDFDLAASRTFPTGRAGGLLALQAAIQALESGQAERVLVGGIDTYLDLYLLGTLDQQSRIQSSQVMDGLIPGEAAAFLLVSDPSSEGVEPLAGVLALAVADEPGHRGSEEPYRGDGLAERLERRSRGIWQRRSDSDRLCRLNWRELGRQGVGRGVPEKPRELRGGAPSGASRGLRRRHGRGLGPSHACSRGPGLA